MSPSSGKAVVEAIHIFLLIVIGWSVLMLFKPQVFFFLHLRRNRSLKTNEPSDASFTMLRIGSVFILVFFSVLLFVL